MKKPYYLLLTLIVVLCGVRTHAQIISAVAGNGINGYTGDGGSAVDAACHPGLMGFDSSGNIYMADAVHDVVRKISTNGIITTVAGTGHEGFSGNGVPATSTNLANPADVAVDNDGNIYFTEMTGNLIKKISTDGIIHTVAGGGLSRDLTQAATATSVSLWAPTGITIDNQGNIYFTEEFNHCISKINSAGIITTIAGVGTGGYNGDNIMASDAQLNYPQGIVTDQFDNIYFADAGNERIRKISASGIITTIAGTGAYGYNGDNILATTALLHAASDVATDKDNNVYIADPSNERIRKVDNAGIITTIAGTGIAGFSGDGGIAIDAQLNYPGGIGVNKSGFIYIADGYNDRLRYIHSTLAVRNVNKRTDELMTYPNPNNGTFTIKIATNITEQVRAVIINVLGKQVRELMATTNKDLMININFAPGIYFLTAYTSEGRFTERVSIVE